MLGDDLKKGLESDINNLLRDYKMGRISKNKANLYLNQYNDICKNSLLNGNKRQIKKEINKVRFFLK